MAISIAKASLFEDFEEFNDEGAFGLAEDFGDFAEGRKLQNAPMGELDNEEEITEKSEVSEGDDDSDNNRNKRAGRRGRGRMNKRRGGKGQGRWGKKNKRGGKKGEGFNLEKFQEKHEKRIAKMEKRSAAKCEKKAKFQAAVCGKSEDAESCTLWAETMMQSCVSKNKCKLYLTTNQGVCSGAYKAMLTSFRKEDSPLMEKYATSDSIGNCFKNTIDEAQQCFIMEKEVTAGALQEINVPSEELIAEVKAEKKAERQNKNKNRRESGSSNWWNKKQNKRSNRWNQGNRRWEKKEVQTQDRYEKYSSDDDDA